MDGLTYWYHPESDSYLISYSESEAMDMANQGCDQITKLEYNLATGPMQLITLDKETFYGDGYSLTLKEMTTEKYIRDPQFKVHGMGVQIGKLKPVWVTGKKVANFLPRLHLERHALVGHNLQFDGSILAWRYGIVPKLYIDTLGMSRAIVGPHSARHGLKYVAEVLCGMTKMDELAKAYNIYDLPAHIEERLADYTIGAPRWNEEKQLMEAGDVVLTRAILEKMLPHFPKKELLALDWTIRAFTCPRLYLDTEMLAQYIDEVRQEKQQALADAGLESRDLLMSNPKFAEALQSYGITPPTKINKKGKVTFAFAKTDEGLKELLTHPIPQVQALVAARLAVKSTIEETRAVLYHDASTRGAWPAAYNYAGAQVTQRYSGNKGGGGNPQNLKRGGTLRRAIFTPEGEVCGVADLSQIEARITLWLGMQITGPDGEEARALKVMEEGGDIYGWFGTKIYGYEITKDKTPFERQVAKSAVLGLGFGMGPGRFIDYCAASGIKGIDARFAEDIVRLYRTTFPGVRKFWSQCTKAVNLMLDGNYGVALPFDGTSLVRTELDPIFNDSGIRLPNGLYIKYPDLQKDAEGEITYRDGTKRVKLFGGKVCENIVQAVAALIMRMQKIEMHKTYWVAMTTHDELVCIVPEGEEGEKEFVEYATKLMTRPIEYLPGLPLGVEASTAIRYGDAK